MNMNTFTSLGYNQALKCGEGHAAPGGKKDAGKTGWAAETHRQVTFVNSSHECWTERDWEQQKNKSTRMIVFLSLLMFTQHGDGVFHSSVL